jgi:peroxiredoxin
MSQLPIGAQAPDFQLNDLKGRTHRLFEALTHGPVALVFYKSACPTCQITFPWIQKIFSKAWTAPGLTFWGISEDDVQESQEVANEHGLTFDVLIDEHPYDVSAAYGLEFVPSIFLIQPDGRISLSEVGFTKAGLNQLAGFDVFGLGDRLPATRPGCRSKN